MPTTVKARAVAVLHAQRIQVRRRKASKAIKLGLAYGMSHEILRELVAQLDAPEEAFNEHLVNNILVIVGAAIERNPLAVEDGRQRRRRTTWTEDALETEARRIRLDLELRQAVRQRF